MLIKTGEEVELIRESSLLVGKTLGKVAKLIKPGVKTIELDRIAEEFIRDNNALPGFKGYNGFPNTLCVSVNDQVVHGIPGDRILVEGDIASIDCGVIKNAYWGDSAYSFSVGEINKEIELLMKRTKESLYNGIENAVAGKRIGDIGFAIQNYVERYGYSVVRDLVGHGLGSNLHEKPEIPNFGKRGSGMKLKEGMVIAIEPMINLGKKEVVQESDGWTIRTADKKPSAHFEHNILIKKGKSEILSTFDYIEKVLNKN